MMRRRQGGWIHFAVGDCVWFLALVGLVGWAVIEGGLWLLRHVTVGWS